MNALSTLDTITQQLEYPLPKLAIIGETIQQNKLIIETIPEETSGSFMIKNTGGQTLSGFLASADPMLVLDNKEFCANQFRVNYKVSANNYNIGEIVYTSILVSTSGGERTIPVIIKIVPRSLERQGVVLGNLKDFAAYARKQPKDAEAVFISDEFALWLRELQTEYLDIYDGMRTAPSTSLALESFLVLHKLKNPVALSVREEGSLHACQNALTLEHEIIENETSAVHGSITLQRQLWGSFDAKVCVKYGSSWLNLTKSVVTEDDFAGGNTAVLSYSIDPSLIRSGRVSDKIVVDDIEIAVKVKASPAFECHINNAYLKTGSKGVLLVRNLSGLAAKIELSVSDSFIRPDSKNSVWDIPPGTTEIGFTAKLSPIQSAQMLIKKQPTASGEFCVRITQGGRTFTKNLSVTIGELDQ